MCVAGLFVANGCDMSDVTIPQEETTHFLERDMEKYQVGEIFESEYFIITYNSVKQVDSVNDGKNKPVEGYEFYQLDLTIENKVDEEKHVYYECFVGFADDKMIDQFYFTDDILRGNLLKAGDSVTGTLTYSVPKDADKVEVIYQYDQYHEEMFAFIVK